MVRKKCSLFAALVLTFATHAAPLSKADRLRYQRRLDAISSRLGSLTDEQLDLMAEVHGGVEIDRDLIAFVLAYGGGREALTTHLRQLRDERQAVQQGRSDEVLQGWLERPGFAEAERLYRMLKAQGWSIELTNGELTRKGKPVSGLTTGRTVRVRVALTDESPAMILLEELLHAADLRIYEAHKSVIRDWLRLVIAENKTPGIDRVSQAERFSWQYQRGIAELAKIAVSEAEIDQALEFVLEQSAYQRKLLAYKAIVKAGPSYRQEMWENVVASTDPHETINLILSELRFENLPPGLTTRIGTATLAEIAGSSENELPGASLPSITEPELPWTTLEEFAAVLPGSFNSIDLSFVDVYDDNAVRRHASAVSESEIEAYGRYLLNPALSALPYRAAEILRRRFGYARKADVYRQYLYVCALLVQYDLLHDTHHTETYGFPMISLLHRDRGMRDYDALTGMIARRFRQPGTTPEMAAGFVNALVRSRAAGGFLNDPNQLYDLKSILILAGDLVAIETVDAILTSRYRHFTGAAKQNREGSSFLDLVHAHDTLRAGLDVMNARGDELEIRKYEARLVESQEQLDRSSKRDREQRSLREPTPSDYGKTKMPESAAALIVAAQKVREALENDDPASFDRNRFVSKFLRQCADALSRRKKGL